MWPYVLWALAGAALLGAAWAIASAVSETRRARAERRRAQDVIANQEGRLPMRGESAAAAVTPLTQFLSPEPSRARDDSPGPREWSSADLDHLLTQRPEPAPNGSVVETPDGPMVLTPPPFVLRPSLMSTRERAYARAIALKLPSGYVVCPQVRLDALVIPVKPGTRGSAEDWRDWRKRVRLRAVDFVICALPEWRPVVAIEIEPQERSVRPFQRDRIEDEVFSEIGLPLIRCSGTPGDDWAMIAPYVKPRAGSRSSSIDPDGTGAG